MTVGRASLPYLVWYRHHWKQLMCKLNIQRLNEEYAILCFEFDLCGLKYRKQDDSTQRILQEITTPVARGHFINRNRKGTIEWDDSTQHIKIYITTPVVRGHFRDRNK